MFTSRSSVQPRLGCSWPLTRAFRGTALACALAAGLPGEARAYDVVERGGRIIPVTSLAFSGPNALLVTDKGRTSLPASSIDFYETFRLNLGHAGGNLVVFKTGALLRFENLEIKDGSAAVRVAGGSAFVVPESLVDFEGSVREGAMLRLPASAMGTVSVSTSARGGVGAVGATGGGFDEMAVPEEYSVAPPDPEAAPEPPPDAARGLASRPNRPGRPGLNRPRRFGADRGGESGDAVQEVQPLTPDDDSQQLPSDGGDSVPFGRGQQGGGGEQAGGGQSQVATGQTVLLLSTTYSGEIAGLQVTVTFPPNLKVVQPVGFSGFAATLAMPTVNANVPGQVQLIAVNGDVTGPGVQAGGEFLRLTFTWSGRAPTAQQFSVAVKATDPSTGAELPEFPRELSVF